jgi:hypothetical protein
MAHLLHHLATSFGHYNSVKNLGHISFRCFQCDRGLHCTVEEWRRKFYILYIPTRTVAHGYLFTWDECKHSLGIVDRPMV